MKRIHRVGRRRKKAKLMRRKPVLTRAEFEALELDSRVTLIQALIPVGMMAAAEELQREVEQVEEAGAAALHFDVIDGHFAPNITYGMPIIEAVRGRTDLVLDVHLMITEPERYVEQIRSAGADVMTILVMVLALFFLMRRVIVPSVRSGSTMYDFIIIVITALPFLSGYFLTHGTLDSVAFFEEHMTVIHVLSGEAMIMTAVFLFCRTRLNTEKCVACAACEISCPTGTLESEDKENKRIFTYSHYQCICCGACVETCPEKAAELRHEISLNRFLQFIPKQEIRSVDLMACQRCGAFFTPEPQLDKIGKTFTHDYTRFCPRCRKVNIGEVFHQLSPWTKKNRVQPPIS